MIPGDPGDVWSWTSGAAVAALPPPLPLPIPVVEKLVSAGGILALGDELMSFLTGLFRLIPDIAGDGKRLEVIVDSEGRFREMGRRKAVASDSFETLLISQTALTLTPATYAGASGAIITVETADLRYRIDGLAPTASVGHLVTSGNDIVLTSLTAVENFRAIRDAGVDVDITVTYTKAD